MTARLTARMLVSAISRRVQIEGGNAMVLMRGDEVSGSILIACLERGQFRQLVERTLSPDGSYRWSRIGPDTDKDLGEYLMRRRNSDPDMWVLELDIPNAERFAAEVTGEG